MNKKKIIAGLILMISAAVLYAALHDFSKLCIFQGMENPPFRDFSIDFLRRFFFFKFAKNHLADFLWFLSFSLIFTEILPASKKIKFIFLVLLACLSEFSQFFFENLGTFDIIDLAEYFLIALFFLF